MSLSAGFTSCTWPGAAAPQYRKVGPIVHLKGCLKYTGSTQYLSSAFTLPAGHRPSNHGSWMFVARSKDGSNPTIHTCGLQFVFTSGQVGVRFNDTTWAGNGRCCHLTGVSFPSDS